MTPAPDSRARPTADLAAVRAARVDEVGPEAPLPPADIADLFAAMDKAVRSQRLYQTNNPMYHGFIAAAQTAFRKLWESTSSLTAGVEENAFRWYGRTFAAGEGRDSLPFLFYKDGIRFVTFLPGFEDELEKFLDVVNSARALDHNSDDDMVTLLWQSEFGSFQYSYVDALAEGLKVPQSHVPKLAGVELTLTPEDAAGATQPEEVPESARLDSAPSSVAGMISRGDFEETLYFLEPTELARLHDEVELEWKRDVKRDVLNALFDRLEDGLPEWREEILRILRQMLPVFLGAGDIASATRIVVELNAILDSGRLEGELAEEARALFLELSEPAVLTQLLQSLQHGGIDPSGNELGIFLKHLQPAAMPVLLAAIERGDEGVLQDRLRTAMEGLASAHHAELVRLLAHDDVDVLRGAARLAGRLGMPSAAAPLGALLSHAELSVRRAAVDALIRIRTANALESLRQALADEDRDIRVAAARGIAGARYTPARAWFEKLIASREVRGADLTEMMAFFEAYGSVADDASVPMLDRMLNGRRLFGRESAELRACAAMALGRIGSPAARASLERAGGETNPIIRNAVAKALRESPT
jgi:hypothetical protein